MRRGDLITAAFPGDYGKPRPALIVQSDLLTGLGSVLLCPLTSDMTTIGPARVAVEPTAANGLLAASLIAVDKVAAVSRSRCRERIGRLEDPLLEQVNGLLLFVMGLLE